MKKRVILLLVVIPIFAGCINSEGKDFGRAKRSDTIFGYNNFLAMYPDSDKKIWITERIAILKEKEMEKRLVEQRIAMERAKRREMKEKEIAARRAKLDKYQIGNLTEGEFLEDGWNSGDAESTFPGNIGIIDINGDRTRKLYRLGHIETEELPGMAGIIASRNREFMQRQARNGASVSSYSNVKSTVECQLIFVDDILKEKSC